MPPNPPGLLLGCVLVLCATAAAAQSTSARQVPVERQLRQLYLDLLGRPPSLEEYAAVTARGEIRPEDVRELMGREEFYARLRWYHRALLKTNIVASVYDAPGEFVSGTPLSLYGHGPQNHRGDVAVRCDGFIRQDRCDTEPRQDPHAEGTEKKVCYDPNGVPLPVSVDYNPVHYQCTQLDASDATVTSCTGAVSKGLLPDKHLYYCDMQRDSGGALHPWRCLPNPANPVTSVLTREVLDDAGRVVAFENPTPKTGALNRLDRCTLQLPLNGGIPGWYASVRDTGCLYRDGYEMRPPPFWDTSGATEVAVCAIEAQARAANPLTGESCETPAKWRDDRTCGCGEKMRRCQVHPVFQDRVASFNLEPELIADMVVRRDEPYFNLLTTRRSFVNGPLSGIYKDKQHAHGFAASPPAAPELLPGVPYAQKDVWKEYVRDPHHSGVLTTAAYLLRFPTARSRVSEFYDAFLCKTFQPPPDASLPPPEDSCNRENNLAKRCGCNYCHATIEPAGSHWGRYRERGATFLDPVEYPKFSQKCRECANTGGSCSECNDYVLRAYDAEGATSLGMLKSYLYRTPSEEENIELGPRMLVERMMQTGDLERCAVRRFWNFYLGRPMTEQEQQLYLDSLSRGFQADGYRLKSLIERILSTDAYRRID
jgi:hypothetical protein